MNEDRKMEWKQPNPENTVVYALEKFAKRERVGEPYKPSQENRNDFCRKHFTSRINRINRLCREMMAIAKVVGGEVSFHGQHGLSAEISNPENGDPVLPFKAIVVIMEEKFEEFLASGPFEGDYIQFNSMDHKRMVAPPIVNKYERGFEYDDLAVLYGMLQTDEERDMFVDCLRDPNAETEAPK